MNVSLRRYKLYTVEKCEYVVSCNMTTALRRLREYSNSIFGGGCLRISIRPGHAEQKPKEV